jgi:hypothetical protein
VAMPVTEGGEDGGDAGMVGRWVALGWGRQGGLAVGTGETVARRRVAVTPPERAVAGRGRPWPCR